MTNLSNKEKFALIRKRLMATFPCDHSDHQLVGDKSQWGKCNTCEEVFRTIQLPMFRERYLEQDTALDALSELETVIENHSNELTASELEAQTYRKSLEHVETFISEVLSVEDKKYSTPLPVVITDLTAYPKSEAYDKK